MNYVDAKIQQHSELVTLRQPHEQVWRDCYDFTHPIRGMGFNGEIGDSSAAQSKRAELTDSTAPDSALILASEIHSGMTPANSLWFGMAVDGADEEGRRWLGSAAKTLWENIHMANFDAAGFEASIDAVEAGWFALYVTDDKERGGFIFEQWPIYQVFAACSKPGGMIDIVHRRYKLTALQCVEEFGANGVSAETLRLSKDKPQEMIEILHVIEPRKTYAVDAKLAKNLPISSCHIEFKSKALLRESGYHEMPVLMPRMMKIPDSVYATGRVADALPVVKRLNTMCRLEMAGADLAVSGMWIAQDDGVLNPRTVRVGARKIIVAASVDSMKALSPSTNFQVSDNMIERMQGAIRRMLLADSLPPADGPVKTAYEYSVRINLLRKLLGPIFGRLQSEYLTPLITRCFGLAFRAGVFTPPPESLAGRNFTVKYIGPLARAQQLEEVTAIEAYMQQTLAAGQAVPDIMDNCDFDEGNRRVGEGRGVPAAVIRKIEDRDKLRAKRAEAQQEQMEQQQAMQMQQEAGSAMIQQAANQ